MVIKSLIAESKKDIEADIGADEIKKDVFNELRMEELKKDKELDND